MKRYICFLFFLIGLIVCNKTHSFNEDHTSSRLAGAAVPAIYFVLPIAKIGVTELFAHIAVPTVAATIIDFFAKYIKRKKAFVFNGSELKSPMPMLDPEKNDDEDEPVFVANMKQFFEKHSSVGIFIAVLKRLKKYSKDNLFIGSQDTLKSMICVKEIISI